MNKLVMKLSENDVVIQKLLMFQGIEVHREELKDIIWDAGDDVLEKMLGIPVEGRGEDEIEDLFEMEFTGYFIAQIHTPIREWRSKTGFRSSWGYTTYTTIMAKTMEELVDIACKWGKEEFKSQKKKGLEKLENEYRGGRANR